MSYVSFTEICAQLLPAQSEFWNDLELDLCLFLEDGSQPQRKE